MAYYTPSIRRALKRAGRTGLVTRVHSAPEDFRKPSVLGLTLGGAAIAALLTGWVFAPAHALSNAAETPPPATTAEPVAAEPAPPRPAERPAQIAAVTPAAQAEVTLASAPKAPEIKRGPVTRLPIPRYVSLKGDKGNVRRGPSLSHRIDWVFRHSGMPLRVVAEFGHWRRVEDRDGAGGWVHYQLLSGVRTAIVQQDMVELRARPDMNSGVIAVAENGAIVRLGECEPAWCRILGAGARGWVPKSAIWGVDAQEIRD